MGYQFCKELEVSIYQHANSLCLLGFSTSVALISLSFHAIF